MVGIRKPSAPLVATELDDVENRFGFKFPQEVRSFYLAANGGRPEKDRFVYGDQMCTIHELLPIKHGKKSLTLEATLLRVRSLLPDHLIPFAVDPGGDFSASVRGKRTLAPSTSIAWTGTTKPRPPSCWRGH